jgi:hypothetical protein
MHELTGGRTASAANLAVVKTTWLSVIGEELENTRLRYGGDGKKGTTTDMAAFAVGSGHEGQGQKGE